MISRPPHPCPLPRRGEGVSSSEDALWVERYAEEADSRQYTVDREEVKKRGIRDSGIGLREPGGNNPKPRVAREKRQAAASRQRRTDAPDCEASAGRVDT